MAPLVYHSASRPLEKVFIVPYVYIITDPYWLAARRAGRVAVATDLRPSLVLGANGLWVISQDRMSRVCFFGRLMLVAPMCARTDKIGGDR